jgi:hypothetical protein
MEERRLTVKCCNVNAFVCNIIINVHLVLRKHAFPRICAFYSFDLLTEVHTTRRYVPQKLETQARTASLRLAVPVVDRCIFFAAKNSGNRKLGDCFVSQSDILRVLIVLYLWCELEPLLPLVWLEATRVVIFRTSCQTDGLIHIYFILKPFPYTGLLLSASKHPRQAHFRKKLN